MQWAKRLFGDSSRKYESIILICIFLFVFINWLLLTMVEKIAPPDFYKLYGIGEKLFTGDLKIGIIPPLFSLLLYPLGKFISLFTEPENAFILSGRIISLIASLGVLWITYLFLRKFTEKWAVIGTFFLAVSPWYLKLVAFPITDMLGLLFVAAAFYSFLTRSWKLSIISTVAGVFTRFEGILLILAAFINYFKAKKRYFIILLASVPLVAGLFFFFLKFIPRFFNHLRDIIISQKTYLYAFMHPLEFMNLIYGNILYFIPYSFPSFLKWFLFVVVLVFFGYGIYRLFLVEKKLTIAILAYEIFFLIAKGYINPEDPDREFRRILPGLWLFYVVAVIGGYFLLKEAGRRVLLRKIITACAAVFFIAIIVCLPVIGFPLILPALLFIPVLIYCCGGSTKEKTTGQKVLIYLAMIVPVLFIFQIYHHSYNKSSEYVDSYAHKAAYASARWLNYSNVKDGAVILSFTDNTIMDYYLEKGLLESRNITRMKIQLPFRNTPKMQERFKIVFLRELRRKNVDYIIFDNYVVQKPEFQGFNDIQKLLYEEKENKNIFRLKYLSYKGKSVGYVLRPINVQTYR